MNYQESVAGLEAGLSARDAILDRLGAQREPLAALRKALRRNAFAAEIGDVNLQPIVASLDSRSRQEGLHLTQAWDFGKHVFTDDSIPVLLLDYCSRLASRKADDRSAAGLLLDQYFVSVLSLLTVRAWDEGDPNANLDRVSDLLHELQGPAGSGRTFIDDAESLLFLSISYFHPEEIAYDVLLARVEQLDAAHQLRVAAACAGMMSAHLRWGLRFMYQRDIGRMRDDNIADYPWLSHAVGTLAREYDTNRQSLLGTRQSVVELLMLGLAADPSAFVGAPPPVLARRTSDNALVREVLAGHRAELAQVFDSMRPTPRSYSPLGFTCNFPTNAAVAMVAVSVEDGRSYPPLNALFSAQRDPVATQSLATRLMDYSVSDPSRLGAGQAPLIAYDPFDGASAANALARCLR